MPSSFRRHLAFGHVDDLPIGQLVGHAEPGALADSVLSVNFCTLISGPFFVMTSISPFAPCFTIVMVLLRSSIDPAEKSAKRAMSSATMKATLTSNRLAIPASGSSSAPGGGP